MSTSTPLNKPRLSSQALVYVLSLAICSTIDGMAVHSLLHCYLALSQIVKAVKQSTWQRLRQPAYSCENCDDLSSLLECAGQVETQAAVEAVVRREQAEADRRVLEAKEEALKQSQGCGSRRHICS